MIKTCNDLKEWIEDYNKITPIFKAICARCYDIDEFDMNLFGFYFSKNLCIAEWHTYDDDGTEHWYEYKFPYDWVLKPWFEVVLEIDKAKEERERKKKEEREVQERKKAELLEAQERSEYERLKKKYGDNK